MVVKTLVLGVSQGGGGLQTELLQVEYGHLGVMNDTLDLSDHVQHR